MLGGNWMQYTPLLGLATPAMFLLRLGSRKTPVLKRLIQPYARAVPGSPCGPLSPCAPVSPFGPASPCGPCGSWPALKSCDSNAPFFTFDEVTAFFLICLLPTLFFGNCVAAYAPPPSARN